MATGGRSPIIGPGTQFKFYTGSRFLNRADKELGTIIADMDKRANEAFQVVHQSCPGFELQVSTLGKLDALAVEYVEYLERLERDRVNQNGDLYQAVLRSIRDVVYNKKLLQSEIQDCMNRKAYPELENAIKASNISAMRQAGAAEPSSESSKDEQIRAKIIASKILKACGFDGFETYAGGVGYQRFFDDYMVYPFTIKNYSKEIKGTLGTMLFGPPGTGKTKLAEAVAHELEKFGATFFSITSATIKGKWSGESEKSIKILFEEARKATNGGKRPVVIFIDEAEGLLDEKSAHAGGGVLSQLNSEMQGASNNDNRGLIVIIATNFPYIIPDSAVSRFANKIYVGLPNADDARTILVQYFESIGSCRYNLDGVEIDTLPLPADEARKAYKDRKPAKKRMLTIPGMQRAGQNITGLEVDPIDFIAYAIENRRYSHRDISDALLMYIKGRAYGQSKRFYDEKVPKGGRLGSHDVDENNKPLDYIKTQMWILNKPTFKHRIMNPNGSCGPTKEESKHELIPVGFYYLDNIVNGYEMEYGTLGNTVTVDKNTTYKFSKTMPMPGRPKEAWVVVTERTIVKDENDPEDPGHWEYKIIKQENDNGDLEDLNIPDVIDAETINSILGSVQITMSHWEDAFNAIRPLRIRNARKMLAYAVSPGRTIDKVYARNYDMQAMLEMAEEEEAEERNGNVSGVGDFEKLRIEVEKIIASSEDPTLRDFSWSTFMGEMNAKAEERREMKQKAEEDISSLREKLQNLNYGPPEVFQTPGQVIPPTNNQPTNPPGSMNFGQTSNFTGANNNPFIA